MATSAGPEAHQAQLYDDLPFLAAKVAAFFAGSLRVGGVAVAVARPEHLAAIGAVLADSMLDATALTASGKLILLDAEATLSALSTNGSLDRAKFRTVVGGVLAAAKPRTAGPIRIYGEMVDVLWSAGRTDEMLALEALWNEILHDETFELLCGYRLGGFSDSAHAHTFQRVCAAHGTVAPSERVGEIVRRSSVEVRLANLLSVVGELAASETREDIARIAIDHVFGAIEAASGGLWLIDAETSMLELLAISSQRVEVGDRWSQLPLAGETPVATAARLGESLFIDSLADYRARFPASFERVAATLGADAAYAILPLFANGAVIGVLGLTFETAQRIDGDARTFLEILARQCGLALDRVRLREIERAAREETALLYHLTSACNQIEEIDEIYELALSTVARGTGSDRAAILLFDGDGVMRFAASHGLSTTYRAAVEGHSPWTREAVAPQPVLVADTETDPAWAAYLAIFRAEGLRSLAFVPLVHHGVLLGKFMLYRNAAHSFDASEIRLAQAISTHVAQAVVRVQRERELARSYRVERQAHLEAEEATRAREEILSVVSHDLRTPLGTIMVGSSTLLHAFDATDATAQRVTPIAERIHRQAERMARLIDDLVDFAGIQAGKLAIARSPQAPESLIATTNDLFRPIAAERGLMFEAAAVTALPAVDCDAERVVQIFGNLVGNAIKVTPRGGSISIGAHPEDDRVVFYVRDTGPGISPDEMPSLFERYWRSKQAPYKGAGLGLSIARGLVEAHGGRIWAESVLGGGSTFFFSLTSTRN